MRYYENGDLYSYLDESMEILCWRDILDILWGISTGLNFIHEHDLVHGHLHGGNILIEMIENEEAVDAKIAGTGLHGPADVSSQQIYGVIPFIAPEIFDGNAPTKAADIYSFGMIMWMLSTRIRPYCDRPHDLQLIQEIISGLRPNVINGTSSVFAKLIFECLDPNPLNRPSISQLKEHLENWITEIYDDSDPSDLSDQFDVVEQINLENLKFNNDLSCHEKAIYFSRPLNPFFYGQM